MLFTIFFAVQESQKKMACLQIGSSSVFSPVLRTIQHGSGLPRTPVSSTKSSSFRCKLTEDGGSGSGSTGEEPAESLFIKELKRRGMTATPRLQERTRERFGQGEIEVEMEEESGGRGGGGAKWNGGVASAEYEKGLEGQRERSMALNSEGLEGLIPRAKLLLSLGGTFFLSFGPLILVTAGVFSALYLYFGPTFVHGASKSVSSPHVDAYTLLEDERISQMAPPLK